MLYFDAIIAINCFRNKAGDVVYDDNNALITVPRLVSSVESNEDSLSDYYAASYKHIISEDCFVVLYGGLISDWNNSISEHLDVNTFYDLFSCNHDVLVELLKDVTNDITIYVFVETIYNTKDDSITWKIVGRICNEKGIVAIP